VTEGAAPRPAPDETNHSVHLTFRWRRRIGGTSPKFITQSADRLAFLYRTSNEAYLDLWRMIPIGKPHNQVHIDDFLATRDSVASWDGDTLVIDTLGLSDETWLGSDGRFHSADTQVIERMTRKGDTLRYDVTIEDPDVLVKPWVRDSITYVLNPDPNASL
jgi:hypothetical protein